MAVEKKISRRGFFGYTGLALAAGLAGGGAVGYNVGKEELHERVQLNALESINGKDVRYVTTGIKLGDVYDLDVRTDKKQLFKIPFNLGKIGWVDYMTAILPNISSVQPKIYLVSYIDVDGIDSRELVDFLMQGNFVYMTEEEEKTGNFVEPTESIYARIPFDLMQLYIKSIDDIKIEPNNKYDAKAIVLSIREFPKPINA